MVDCASTEANLLDQACSTSSASAYGRNASNNAGVFSGGLIQTLRERYSLEEIVEMLSPDIARRRYSRDDVAEMAWITTASLTLFPADDTIGYTFNDLLCLLIIEQLRKATGITREQIQLVVITLLARLSEMDDGCTERRLSLLTKDNVFFIILHCGNCLVDQATHICITLDIDRSNTTLVIPFSLTRWATSVPTSLAPATLVPLMVSLTWSRKAGSLLDADASVCPAKSSIACT